MTAASESLHGRDRQQAGRKGEAVEEIALGETARFLHKTMEPFEPEALEPSWGALDVACDEGE